MAPALHDPAQPAHLEALHGGDRDHRVDRQRGVENAEEIDARGDASDDDEEQNVHSPLLHQRLKLGPEHLLHLRLGRDVERGDGGEVDARVPALAVVRTRFLILFLLEFLFVFVDVNLERLPVPHVPPVQPSHVEDGEEQREDPWPQVPGVAGHHEHAKVVRDDDAVDLIRPVLVHRSVDVLHVEHVERRDVQALKRHVDSKPTANPSPRLRPRLHIADVLDGRLVLSAGAFAVRVVPRPEQHRSGD